MIASTIAIFSVVGSASFVVAAARPKLYVYITLWAIIFADTLEQLTGVLQFSYLDEVFLAVAIIVFPARRLRRGEPLVVIPGSAWLILFVASGLVSALVNLVPIWVMLLGAGIAVKGFVLTFAVAQIEWRPEDLTSSARHLVWIALVALGGGLVNLLAPVEWSRIFSLSGTLEYRFGIPSLIGPFTLPTVFALLLALVSVATVSYHLTIRKSWASVLLICVTALGSILGMRRRLWLSLLSGIATVVAKSGNRLLLIVGSIVLVPVLLIPGWEILSQAIAAIRRDYFAESSQFEIARTVMAVDAFHIANSGLVLGVGFGRFGSWIAAVFYSPEYSTRGYEGIYGLTPLEAEGSVNFLTDTFWPAIMGETGWLGTIAFVMLLVSLWHALSRFQRNALDPWERCLALTTSGWLVCFLVDSTASPAFNQSLSVLLFLALGISLALSNRSSAEARQ